jgi:hypothetical protein
MVVLNVTGCPVQAGFALAVIETDTGIEPATCIVMALDVAGFPVAQLKPDESTHVITSPSKGV